MASYELSEETREKIVLENSHGYILLEESTGPEGWEPVSPVTSIWVPVPRVTR